MAQGIVAMNGIAAPKGCIYTQTLGVHPDRITVFAVPQATAIPTRGNITISYGLTSVVLANCYFEDVHVVSDVSDGHLLALTYFDRRERWTLADTIQAEFNTQRVGTLVTGDQRKSLRQLAFLLLEFMGETSPNVSALSDEIYPEVRWDDIHPTEALNQLLHEYGFSIALGFGAEPVTVVQLGVGASLPTGDAMMASSTIDPKVRPEYIRVRFNDSLIQARIKLEAIGLEPDDTWEPINDLSYKPTSWDLEDPRTLPNVKEAEPEGTWLRAVTTVYRAYRIKDFGGSLALPDGSGTLTSISQILPLRNHLLDSESIRDDGSYIPFRIYGKRQIPYTDGEPAKVETTSVDDEVVGERVRFDGENGLLIFEEPQYFVEERRYKPAELWLECTFSVKDLSTYYPMRYIRDVLLDATSEGFRSIPYREQEKRTVVTYGASQSVTGHTTNESDLNALADLIADAVAVQYVTTGAQVVIYCEPKLALRCDGAIQQIRHIISDGTRHAGSFSTASLNVEFDRQIMMRDERSAIRNSLLGLYSARAQAALARRRYRTDD